MSTDQRAWTGTAVALAALAIGVQVQLSSDGPFGIALAFYAVAAVALLVGWWPLIAHIRLHSRRPFVGFVPDIEFVLDKQANLQVGGFDYLVRVYNHGSTKRFKATFTVPDGCPRNDRIYHDPTQTYWWEKAEDTVSEIHRGEEDYFKIANQRTKTLPEAESNQYPNHQFTLYRYDDERGRPVHFCREAYFPKTMDDYPRVLVIVSVSSVSGDSYTARQETFSVHTGGVDRVD